MDFEKKLYQTSRARISVDEGLRSYMLKVYNYMALGLALTGIVALFVASSPTMLMAIFGSPLKWVVLFAPVVMVLILSFRIQTMSASSAQIFFWVYAGLMGLSLSSIFIAYTGASIARVFFITGGTFAAMSFYGYTTKRDLTAFGSFLMMGVIGILIASIVNMFMHSSALHFAISVIGVLVFTGLTAYDTQKIKESYYSGDDSEVATKKAVLGALNLYMDFINLFIMLLRLFGDRR